MKFATMGSTGLVSSRLALGTMSFGGDADKETSAAMYRAARDAGINHFDCADVYNGGKAEQILGWLIADHRDDVIVASKAYFPTGAGPNERGNSRYHLVRAVEASLRRLRTDRLDIFYLHRWDDNTDIADSLRTLDDLVRQGKILYPALSNVAAWQAAKAITMADAKGWVRPACVQPMYNLAKRQAEVEILPMAQAENIGVIPYSPLGGGLLSGKYGAQIRPAGGRLIDNGMYATRYGAARNYQIAEGHRALATKRGVHPVALAVAWVASHPAVTAPLLGARNLEQLRPALTALDIEMTTELLAEIDEYTPSPPPATDRNEETSTVNYAAILQKK